MLASLLRKVSFKANFTLRSIKKSSIKLDFNSLQRNVQPIFAWSSTSKKALNDSCRILFPHETQLNFLQRGHSLTANNLSQRLLFLPSRGCHQFRNEPRKFKLVKRRSLVEQIAESEKKLREKATKSSSTQDNICKDSLNPYTQESFKDPRKTEAKDPPKTETKELNKKCEHSDQKWMTYDDGAKDSKYPDGFLNKAETSGTRVPCNRKPDRGSCCTQKDGECSKSDGLPLTEEEMAAPDPPPPKPTHWTENLKKRQKRRQVASPMIYIPYQQSKPKKSKLTYKEEMRQCDQTHGGQGRCDQTEQMSKSVKSGRDFVPYVCNTPKHVSESDKGTLKYRLSKCPEVMDSLKSEKLEEFKYVETKHVSEKKVEKRKMVKGYQSSGEWRKRKYPVRLRIYKRKDQLNPCPPVMTDSRKDGAEYVEVKPRLSPVNRELVKKVSDPCPPKFCPNVDIEKTKIKAMRKKKVKRLKSRVK